MGGVDRCQGKVNTTCALSGGKLYNWLTESPVTRATPRPAPACLVILLFSLFGRFTEAGVCSPRKAMTISSSSAHRHHLPVRMSS